MRYKTGFLISFVIALIISGVPSYVLAYDGDNSDTMWGSTIYDDNNNTVLVANNNQSTKHKSKSTSADQKPTYTGYSYGFPKHRAASNMPVFIFNPKTRAWAFYDIYGNLLKTGHGSGGSNYCPDLHHRCHTPTGTFHVYAKGGAGCKSKKFPIPKGGAPMPYCNYFHNGFAIHGSYEVRSYNASHGCIRIYPADAKWLQGVMPIGTTVIVMPY